MGRQRNWSKSSYKSTSDRVGSSKIPVEGTEAPRSFAEGTGKRKYNKNDPSVEVMRKRRAQQYRTFGVGVPGSTSFVLSKYEMIQRGILNADGTRKKRVRTNGIHGPKPSSRSRKTSNSHSIARMNNSNITELAQKMKTIHDGERDAARLRMKTKRNNRSATKKSINLSHVNLIKGLDKLGGSEDN